MDVTNRDEGRGGFALSERRLEVPYEKDYDAIAGEGPLQWAHRFDLSNWALFTARIATLIVGGAAVAFDTPGLTMLEGRRDLQNACDENPTGAVTRNVFVNNVRLIQNATTPGNGDEPGFAFTVAANGTVTQ